MAELISVIVITLLAAISPGPDFAMVSRNSLILSRRTGVMTAIGIGLGILVHVTYSILGIGLIVSKSVLLFTAFKIAGACYLLYLGIRMMRAKAGAIAEIAPARQLTDWQALRVGFFTNALNPKATLFVVSLFTAVVHPATPLVVQIGYGAYISVVHIVWFSLVAIFFSAGPIRMRIMQARHWIDRAFGAMLAGLGIMLATTSLKRS